MSIRLQITILLLRLIETDVFQIPQLHKHFNVSHNFMETVNQDNILQYLTTSKIVLDLCDHFQYLEWNSGKDELTNSLIKVGQIDTKPNLTETIPYWGQDAPINFEVYPYYDCEICRCVKCKKFFFYYIELGGHGPQKRYRLIRKELIALNSIKPKTKIIIDSNGFEYTVFKNPDLTYGISIPKSIEIGVDIYHQLTKNEENLYLQKGISALKERMKDMDKNYNNYKVTSWR